MSSRCQLFDYSGKRRLRSLSRKDGERMFGEGVVFRLGKNFALMKPKLAAEGKRGIVQSRNPGAAKPIRQRINKRRGRGTMVRGGRGCGYELALIGIAEGCADAETFSAVESWGRKNERTSSNPN